MSRPKRILKKKFVVFCEGDTEFHYIDHMRKNQGVEISLQLINMKGGGYSNFLNEIKTKAQTNCLAKFIIVDADRISSNSGEKSAFMALLDYCRLQNRKRTVPHFLIVDNPDFEYAACLHVADYKGQDTAAFITKQLGFKSLEQFKGKDDIYIYLNTVGSYQNLLNRIQDRTIANPFSCAYRMTLRNTDRVSFTVFEESPSCSLPPSVSNVLHWHRRSSSVRE